MRVGIDATPLLGPRTGIGTYTVQVISGMAAALGPDAVQALTFGMAPADLVRSHLPTGVRAVSRRVPARALHHCWSRWTEPSLEWFTRSVDLFHATNFVAPPTRRAAVVLTIHDLTYLRYPQTVSRASLAYRDLVPATLRRGAVVCTDSRAVADEVIDAYGVSEDRIRVAHLGVDPRWFEQDQADTPPVWPTLADDYIVAVGTVEPRKNLGVVMAAYRVAEATGTPLPTLVIVGAAGWGTPPDLTGLPPGRVVVTGHLPDAEVRRIVAGARVLVFPSLYEGFGLPPLEALACGTPVLAADLPVTREVLQDQALFVDAHNAEAVLDGIHRALVAPAGTPTSRAAHAATFSWEACVRHTLAAYRQAVGG